MLRVVLPFESTDQFLKCDQSLVKAKHPKAIFWESAITFYYTVIAQGWFQLSIGAVPCNVTFDHPLPPPPKSKLLSNFSRTLDWADTFSRPFISSALGCTLFHREMGYTTGCSLETSKGSIQGSSLYVFIKFPAFERIIVFQMAMMILLMMFQCVFIHTAELYLIQ